MKRKRKLLVSLATAVILILGVVGIAYAANAINSHTYAPATPSEGTVTFVCTCPGHTAEPATPATVTFSIADTEAVYSGEAKAITVTDAKYKDSSDDGSEVEEVEAEVVGDITYKPAGSDASVEAITNPTNAGVYDAYVSVQYDGETANLLQIQNALTISKCPVTPVFGEDIVYDGTSTFADVTPEGIMSVSYKSASSGNLVARPVKQITMNLQRVQKPPKI